MPKPMPKPVPKPAPPPSRRGECKCLPKELEGPGNLPIGNCLTRDPANDKHYCYVDRNNGCRDSKPSRRLPDLIYSYDACVNQRNVGFAAPDESGCRDDDEQCWLALLSTPAQSDFGNTGFIAEETFDRIPGFSCKSVDCGCSNDDINCHIDCLNCIDP